MNTAGHPSLDDLLDEIKNESSIYPEIPSAGGTRSSQSFSAGMAHISAHLTPSIPTSMSPADEPADTEPSLSPRQISLPKLDLRAVVGVIGLLVLALGIGSSTYLVQQAQDLRQSAYEQTLPQLQGDPATQTEEQRQEAVMIQQRVDRTQQVTLVGAVILGLAVFALISFLAWLFFT